MHGELYHERQTRLLNNTKHARRDFHSLNSGTVTMGSATHFLFVGGEPLRRYFGTQGKDAMVPSVSSRTASL